MPVTIAVCESGPCRLAGADSVVRAIEDLVGCLQPVAGGIPMKVIRSGCMNLCDHAPNAVLKSPPRNPHTAKRLDRFPAIVALVRRAAGGAGVVEGAEGRADAGLPPAHILKACELHFTAINAQVDANYDTALGAAKKGIEMLNGTACTASEAKMTVMEPRAESGPAALEAVSNQLQCLADSRVVCAFALNSAANQVVLLNVCSLNPPAFAISTYYICL